MKDGKAETVDEFLAPLSPEFRAALETLRQQIRAAGPELEECINYGVPSYRYMGKMALGFGAAKKHLALYPTPGPVEAFKDRLTGYSTSKGAIQFTLDKPLPEDLIADIVRMRVADIAGK